MEPDQQGCVVVCELVVEDSWAIGVVVDFISGAVVKENSPDSLVHASHLLRIAPPKNIWSISMVLSVNRFFFHPTSSSEHGQCHP